MDEWTRPSITVENRRLRCADDSDMRVADGRSQMPPASERVEIGVREKEETCQAEEDVCAGEWLHPPKIAPSGSKSHPRGYLAGGAIRQRTANQPPDGADGCSANRLIQRLCVGFGSAANIVIIFISRRQPFAEKVDRRHNRRGRGSNRLLKLIVYVVGSARVFDIHIDLDEPPDEPIVHLKKMLAYILVKFSPITARKAKQTAVFLWTSQRHLPGGKTIWLLRVFDDKMFQKAHDPARLAEDNRLEELNARTKEWWGRMRSRGA
ncbi:hypothetical protein DFH09DRAFT_1085296 [Mycena vulgaris]|nr:hypothetical protein DFH09DRAFT_1085296 [Mycena vulgaris]